MNSEFIQLETTSYNEYSHVHLPSTKIYIRLSTINEIIPIETRYISSSDLKQYPFILDHLRYPHGAIPEDERQAVKNIRCYKIQTSVRGAGINGVDTLHILTPESGKKLLEALDLPDFE